MSQANYNIDYEPNGAVVGAALDARSQAIASCNSGGSEPTGLEEGGLWLDTSTTPATMKQYVGGIWTELVPSLAGEIIMFAGVNVPNKYLECNGAAVSRTTYANLFAAIGTTYGVGNGSTTFNLPDLRGEFIRGWDHGKGVDSGRALGSSQTEMVGTHNHTATGSSDVQGAHTHSLKKYSNNSGANKKYQPASPDGSHTISWEDSIIDTQGAHSHNIGVTVNNNSGTVNRPRNIALMYCIRF